MLTVHQTTSSYSGGRGCMCGCQGNHSESLRARRQAITALLKNPLTRLDSWMEGGELVGAIFAETATRKRVLYLTNEGVETVKTLGIAPL